MSWASSQATGGTLGAEQLAWLDEASEAARRQHPDRGDGAHAAVVDLPAMGWATEDGTEALGLMKNDAGESVPVDHQRVIFPAGGQKQTVAPIIGMFGVVAVLTQPAADKIGSILIIFDQKQLHSATPAH